MPFLGFSLGPFPARGRGLKVGEILFMPTIEGAVLALPRCSWISTFTSLNLNLLI